MYWIGADDIEGIKDKLSINREICGIIIPSHINSGKLELESRDLGPKIEDGDRGSCKSTNVGLNFHTHPLVVWPWPSTEDMFIVLSDRGPLTTLWGSLIFTEWGVWEIFAPQKFPKETLEKVKEWWTVNASDVLYYDLKLDQDSNVPHLENSRNFIQKFVDMWGSEFGDSGLEIALTGWDSIDGDYYLQTGLNGVKL